jgi:hypothetical protein
MWSHMLSPELKLGRYVWRQDHRLIIISKCMVCMPSTCLVCTATYSMSKGQETAWIFCCLIWLRFYISRFRYILACTCKKKKRSTTSTRTVNWGNKDDETHGRPAVACGSQQTTLARCGTTNNSYIHVRIGDFASTCWRRCTLHALPCPRSPHFSC